MAGLAEILDENKRLREILSQYQTTITRFEAEQKLLQEKLAVVIERAEHLERVLELHRLKHSQPASERFINDAQTLLPLGPEIPPPPRAPEPFREGDDAEENSAESGKKGGKRGGGKRRGPRDFDVDQRDISCPVDPESACVKCGGTLVVFGEVSSYRLNWIPGHFVLDHLIREKCSCPDCPEEGVFAAPVPAALPKAMCGDGLLVRVIIDKFDDHLPLNRQVKRMAREGVSLHTSTLSNWIRMSAGLLKILAEAIRSDILMSDVLQGDDTGFPVQDGVGSLRKGRLWVFTDQNQAFYAFSGTKEGKNPRDILAGLKSRKLVLDGGSEFNKAIRELGLIRAGCWSHLRRYFFESLPHHPTDARLALGTIRDLFLLERRHRELSPEARAAARESESKPLVDGFFSWVRALSQTVRPQSQLAKAVTYARNQEPYMRQFLMHPGLPLHNNLSELMLRQPIVGRKNWLFAGSEGGAKAACTMFTILASCRLQGIDPRAYLLDVLDRLAEYPINRVRELIPRYWKK